jgi:hypothetical protein
MNFVTVFADAHNCWQFWARWIQATPSNHFSLISPVILRLDLPGEFVPSGLQIKILDAAVIWKFNVFWDVMPCRLIYSHRYFWGITPSQTSLALPVHMTRPNISEHLNLHQHCFKNLRSPVCIHATCPTHLTRMSLVVITSSVDMPCYWAVPTLTALEVLFATKPIIQQRTKRDRVYV